MILLIFKEIEGVSVDIPILTETEAKDFIQSSHSDNLVVLTNKELLPLFFFSEDEVFVIDVQYDLPLKDEWISSRIKPLSYLTFFESSRSEDEERTPRAVMRSDESDFEQQEEEEI